MLDRPTFADRLDQLKREPRCFVIGGMYDPHNLVGGLLDLIEEVKPSSVLEIGSHRGISTEVFLLSCRRVTAVDPWEESEEILREFNWRCGHFPWLSVIRGKSPDALPAGNFDLAYIDGHHDYENVKADIAACGRIANRISGHDYYLPEVRQAVDEAGTARTFDDTSWVLI